MRLRNALNQCCFGQSIRLARGSDYEALQDFFLSIRPCTTPHALIRLGGDTDGGYLVPDDFSGIKSCFSPGVADVANFEMEMANRGIRCFLADYSVDAPPVQHPLFHFEKKFLGSKNNKVFMTLEDWVTRNAPGEQDMILQMDIEGAEYQVILETERQILRQFRIIIAEFHALQELAEKRGLEVISLTFQKLLKDFDLVHSHPNNWATPVKYGKFQFPPDMEFTFLRKDRSATRHPTITFPHPLDRPNVLSRKDYPLPDCWYKQICDSATP